MSVVFHLFHTCLRGGPRVAKFGGVAGLKRLLCLFSGLGRAGPGGEARATVGRMRMNDVRYAGSRGGVQARNIQAGSPSGCGLDKECFIA